MKHSYFISDRIRLRAMEPEDLELIYEMENDPQQWDISNFTVPYSRYVMKQYLESSQCDMFADKQLRMIIVRLEDGMPIGTIDITDFAPMHSRGEVGIVLRKEFRGSGYAKEALTLLCDYAFDFLRLRQLIVHVATDNEASMRLFTSCGFVQCGLLKDWLFVEGCFKDVALMQCLRAD
ncbi:GNAT family N-acetyltransferase [Bacteroides stercorirosoris]|jgi:diamine N-acetyltransferase|uniref:N-acetyltransferase n=1 Tax=Bacteroides stercorirosoris TaxID=871324 RepID=A0A1M6IB15_9BACE|nr:GNAT family N-acetyltransferase [Bacteroides stercorirosoris]RGX78319.1 N-acetyltransferase [Bacteroides stercorirosoris]SHJ31662.1 diamine N-acetyltransferase [Bacteroides stercorirosoris]